jgi:hypothetical protein
MVEEYRSRLSGAIKWIQEEGSHEEVGKTVRVGVYTVVGVG